MVKKNKEIDFDRLVGVSDELVDYEDVLPLLIRMLIIKEWSRNLNKKGLYDEIHKRCVDTKPKSYNDAVKELQEWCRHNISYDDLIKG